MSDLLQPDEVREMLVQWCVVVLEDEDHNVLVNNFRQACRDYLTLWDRNQELDRKLSVAESSLRALEKYGI